MYPIDYSSNPLYVDADKHVKSIKEAEETGAYNTWNIERIKGAFNLGRGTVKDFLEYAHRNRCYCNIFEIATGKKIN